MELEEFLGRVDSARRAQEAVNALGAGPPESRKVELSERAQLIEVVKDRLDHFQDIAPEDVSMGVLASLIADDILSSPWKVGRDTTMLTRGRDAGYEKGLREAIMAVGEMERNSGWTGGPQNLIEYDQAQRHIARLSAHGMEAVFDEQMGEVGA